MTKTDTTINEAQERERFEAHFGQILDCRPCTVPSNWTFDFLQTELAWEGWLAAKADAQQAKQPVEAVYLVATGEVVSGQETYTRHHTLPPLCDAETLYTAALAAPERAETPASDDARDAALLQAREALEHVTYSETFFRDPRGDRCGPAIDAIDAAMRAEKEPDR